MQQTNKQRQLPNDTVQYNATSHTYTIQCNTIYEMQNSMHYHTISVRTLKCSLLLQYNFVTWLLLVEDINVVHLIPPKNVRNIDNGNAFQPFLIKNVWRIKNICKECGQRPTTFCSTSLWPTWQWQPSTVFPGIFVSPIEMHWFPPPAWPKDRCYGVTMCLTVCHGCGKL